MLNAIVNTNKNNQIQRYKFQATRSHKMKEKFIQIIAVLSFMLPLAAIGHAQINKNSEFEIPFDFVVRDQVFPAGEYSLRSANDQKSGWIIAGKSGTENVAFLLANTIEDIDRKSEAKLTFRRYGNRYFLAEFTLADYQITLFKTKSEQILQRELLAGNKFAKAEIITTKATVRAK